VAQDAGASQPRAAIETCRLTNKRLACEDAQIIPAAEKSWFAENEMGRYCELDGRFGQDAADSPANLIRLRRDVQVLWDSLFFSIVPKQAQQDADGYDSDSGIKWWAHTTAEDRELYTNYHNRPSSHWLAIHECQRFTERQGRKRRSASSGQSLLDVDSAVSDVDSSGNFDNALTVHPTSQAGYWDVRGWTTEQTLYSTYGSDSDRSQSRGRKRCRN
jgi:hypothetical protein